MIKVSCKGSTFVTHHTQVTKSEKEPKANAYSENPTTDYSSVNNPPPQKKTQTKKKTNKQKKNK